jgi:hypothetical protein
MLHTRYNSVVLPGRLLVLSLTILLLSSASFAANQPPFQVQTVLYQASAYGVYATLGDTILAGPTASATLQPPCGTNQNNLLVTGTAAGVNLPPLVTGGATNTTASSSVTVTAQATSDVVSVNLLAGLISAQEIKSVSTTNLDSNGFHLSAAGSSFTNLIVLGIPINGLPAPNTQIGLPGIGTVTLNEQIPFTNNIEGQLVVNMLHLRVDTVNVLGIPVGTEVILSSSTSGIVRAFAPAVITGTSFGTQVSLAGILNSSPTAPVNLPCYGTAGQTITNSVAGLNLNGILTSGTVTDTGKSALTFPYSTGEMTSQVENLNLLSGLVAANLIYGRVDGTIAGPHGTFETAVGSLVGISVSGHPEINDNVPYNTHVDLAGLGTLYLKRIIRNFPNPSSIEIRPIELVVNQVNVFGLPIGADIIIGDAELTIVPASEP